LSSHDRRAAVKEIIRVLKKNNGKIAFINYFWVVKPFNNLLRQYGIQVESSFVHFTIFPPVCITYGQVIDKSKHVVNV